MKNFVNDERVVGKWSKLAVVSKKEDFVNNIYSEEDIFDFNEIYFLPNGEDYWVFRWTKGILFLKDRELPYEIIDGKLYIGVVDYLTGNIDNYAVYEKIDNKKYTKDEISIKDNTNIPFIKDEKLIGFWQAVDYVKKFEDFVPNKKFWQEPLLFKEYVVKPDGILMASYNNFEAINTINWSKGVIINKKVSTVSEYIIKTIGEDEFMFMEWKSGDYTFGGEVRGYYVFKKIK